MADTGQRIAEHLQNARIHQESAQHALAVKDYEGAWVTPWLLDKYGPLTELPRRLADG